MLQEVALYTSALLLSSYAVPSLIPSFRTSLKQVYATIRTSTIFTRESIHDVHQHQLDAIDRTTGQLMAGFCQLSIVLWAAYNLLIANSIQPLHNFVLGFYAYDIIHLLISPYGKGLQIFLVHHGVTIAFVLYLKYVPLPYYSFINEAYLLLELSGLSINATNVFRQFNPVSKYNIALSAFNLYIYCLTRVLVCPLILVTIILSIAHNEKPIPLLELVPPIFLTGLLGMSAKWFVAMIAKHRRLVQKAII